LEHSICIYSADERDQSIQLHSSVESRLKNREEELAQLRVRLEQQDINADEYKKQLDEKDAINKRVSKELESQKNSFTMCNTELVSYNLVVSWKAILELLC
jgi:exonuclease VII large subunit